MKNLAYICSSQEIQFLSLTFFIFYQRDSPKYEKCDTDNQIKRIDHLAVVIQNDFKNNHEGFYGGSDDDGVEKFCQKRAS